MKTSQPVLPYYQVSDLPFFEEHASRNHELSSIFFRNIFENTKLFVKEEPTPPEHVECKTVLEETDPFEDNSNIHTEDYETQISQYNSGFQLEFVSISRVINHMNCYNSSALIG